jgi:hypothetical protein
MGSGSEERGYPWSALGANSLHDFSFGQRPGGHLRQNRIVRLVVHDGDYPRNHALKTVNGMCRRFGWLLYRQSASCSVCPGNNIRDDEMVGLGPADKWIGPQRLIDV